MIIAENIIYLHNLLKLLWRHITRFFPAFCGRSLPPVFFSGVGRATRRLVMQINYIFSAKVRLYSCPRADKDLVNIFFSSLFASQRPFLSIYCVIKRLKTIIIDFWCKARRRQSLMSTLHSQVWSSTWASHHRSFVGNVMVSSRREVICSRTYKNLWE